MKEIQKIKDSLDGLTGCFVAGGALTSVYTRREINDFDIYPKSRRAMIKACQWAFENGYWAVYVSDRAITFKGKCDTLLQIMTFSTYKKAKDIFKSFDFTINMAAIDLDSGKELLHKDFLKHNSQRFLSFNTKTDFPFASALRVNKYKERGYTIGNAEFFKILMTCHNKSVSSWEELKSQIGGIYGDLIEIPTDGKYTFKKAIKALGSIKQLDNPVQDEILSINDVYIKYWPKDKPIKTINNTYKVAKGLTISTGGLSCKSKAILEGLEKKQISLKEVQGKYLYKVVNCKDGVLFSEYSKPFKYKVGEVAKSDAPYIYCGFKDKIRNYTYFDWNKIKSGERVVLKLAYEDEDIVSSGTALQGNKIQVKKCLVKSVLSVEKVAKLTGLKLS